MDSFKELAQARRSHRIYTDEPVSDEYVRAILRAALMSPTAKGLRKWRFVVTDNKEKIEDLAGMQAEVERSTRYSCCRSTEPWVPLATPENLPRKSANSTPC